MYNFLNFQVERAPDKLLSTIFTKLNQFSDHQSIIMSQGSSQPLCVHKIKVSFDGEPGEGSGVLRSLFTAASEVRRRKEREKEGEGTVEGKEKGGERETEKKRTWGVRRTDRDRYTCRSGLC